MKKKPSTPREIVATFLRSDSHIQCDTISELAAKLCRRARRGSIGDVADVRNRLQKALRSDLFEYEEGGQNFYETRKARKRRCKIPNWAHRSAYINATPESTFA